MPNIELSFPDRSETFSVRSFRVDEAISTPFAIHASALSEFDDADLDGLSGAEVRLSLALPREHERRALAWSGVCAHAELVHAEPTGLSTYALTLVPDLWLLDQRTSCRVFRRLTAPQIALRILREWGIDHELRVDDGAHPVLDFRVQYNETDLAFVSRTLEEAGIAYFFRTVDDRSRLVLSDRPGLGEMLGDPIPFHASASTSGGRPYATRVYRSTHVRPGAYRVRDYDFLRPSFDLHADAAPRPPEQRLERYEYLPGVAVAVGQGRTAGRAEASVLAAVAQRRLDAARTDRKVLSFETNVLGLAPGDITAISGHPRSDITADTRLLVTATTLEGTADGEWLMHARAAFAARAFRPPIATPRPSITGVQSATVVGPAGAEIHVDEHGRVCVLFPWDQEGERGDGSSCWVRVSQAWAGSGFGSVLIPRVGDEVLIAFLDGDPDHPVIVGRLYNATHMHPFRLPEERSRSGIRTRSTRGSGGYNELSFEDRAGFESIKLHAHKDLIENVLHDRHTTVHHDQLERIHGDSSTRVEGTRAESIGQNAVLAVEGNRMEVVSGASRTTLEGASQFQAHSDREERFDAALRTTVRGRARLAYDGGKEEHVSGGSATRVLGDSSVLYGGSRRENVTGPAFMVFGDAVHVTASRGVDLAAGHGSDIGRVRITEDGEAEVEAPSVLVSAASELVLRVGSSSIVIKDDKITLDAETIEIAAKSEVALTTDDASTVWTGSILSKAQAIRAASTDGASLELASKAKLDGPSISLGESASVEKKAFERRKKELPTAPKARVTLRDPSGQTIQNAEYEVSLPGYTDRGTAAGGSIEVPVFDGVDRCVLRWGRPRSDRPPGSPTSTFEFESTIYLRTEVPGDADETARRRLRNLGHHHESLHAAKHAFGRRVGLTDADEGTLTSSIDSEHRG